jgi:hypothetical protein
MMGVFSVHCFEMEGCGGEYRRLRRSGAEHLWLGYLQAQLCGVDREPDRRACEVPMSRC